MRVAVLGANGRMGSATCEAINADPDLELVAKVDKDDPRQAITDAGAEVCVEFTRPDSVFANTAWLLKSGVHAVVGATGLGEGAVAELRGMTGEANALIVPNFAIGAVVMMRLAEIAAAHFPGVEIIELHHDQKVDAPSGTALQTAHRIAAQRDRGAPPGPTGSPARGEIADDIPVHSVRLPGLVAHQEVIFGGLGETLRIRHDSLDRSSFMPGVIAAVNAVPFMPGLTVGLDTVLFDA